MINFVLKNKINNLNIKKINIDHMKDCEIEKVLFNNYFIQLNIEIKLTI